MDNYLDRNRLKPLLSTMANTEAHQLRNEASSVAFRHLKELTTRAHFRDDVERFIASQLQGIKSARTEDECRACLQNIQLERRYIRDQDMALSMGQAKLYASAELRHTLDGWGYVINGVGVVLSGFRVIGGGTLTLSSLLTGNIIGMAGGAILFMHGINGIQEGYINLIKGRNDAIGKTKKTYIEIARFMGFSDKTGLMAYSSMDLLLSGYGMSRLVLEPSSWRLFHYLPSDYIRNYKTMTANALLIEAAGDGLAIKSITDSYSND